VFCSPYLAADAPKVLFHHIEECTETALLGHNPYTDRQLVTNAIRLLLTTGMYIRPFKEWDRLTPVGQTWMALCTMIQEAFQHRLNTTAPTAGHHRYAPALPHQQNAFCMLGPTCVNSDKESVDTVATQVVALMYQSHLTASTAANSSQHAEQQFAHLSSRQNLMHKNMHQIISQVSAFSFNQSKAGHGQLAGNSNGACGRNCGRGTRGVAPTVFDGGQFGAHGGFAPATGRFAPGPQPGIMPYGGMTQGRCTPGFIAPGPPVGIPPGG
jgi:hypothetical protein